MHSIIDIDTYLCYTFTSAPCNQVKHNPHNETREMHFTCLSHIRKGYMETVVAGKMGKREFGIPRVSVDLWDMAADKPIMALSNGYIGNHLTNADELTIQLTLKTEAGLNFMGVELHETTSAVTQLESNFDPAKGESFSRRVKIFRAQDRRLAVDRHSNNIRLVAFGPDGECVLWNVGMVCQNSKFFMTYQTMAHEYAFLENDRIRIPGMEKVRKWAPLGKHLETVLAHPAVRGHLDLRPISEYQQPDEGSLVDGQVLFYSLRQQMGAIHTPKGEARVRWGQIRTERQDGLMYLVKGEVVTYRLHTPPPRAGGKHESSFEWDALNVRVRED
jgi:hypothetical protein